MLKVIALTGKKGSGKDSAAQTLIEDHGYRLVKFAGPLKEMLRTLLKYRGAWEEEIERMIEGDLKEVSTHYLNGCTPRQAMQTLGTEWGRDCISDSLWVSSFKAHATKYDRVVVTDLRFVNEYLAVRQLGGSVYRIVRSEAEIGEDTHVSEQEMGRIPCDAEIINDGTLDDLRAEVEAIVL